MPEQAFAFLESNTSGTGALFVRAAATLGLRPVLLASDPTYYPYVERDGVEAVRLDTQDREALLAACSRLRDGAGLAGIWSSSEYFVPAAASLARELGLPGPDPDAVASCRDKGVQRARLAEAGVGQPSFRIVRSATEAMSAAEALGLPVVVKPVLGTGSLGVRQCADAREVEAAAAAILARHVNERGMSLPERLLVEELAVGPEVSIETFDREVVGFTRKHLGEPPFFVEVGHDFPAPLPATAERVLADTAIRALAALGLGWGPAHLEVKLTTGGPSLIEVNPRLAGGFIPELVRLATGLDSICETVAAAAGRGTLLACKTRQAASIRFLLAPGEGRLVAVEGLKEAAASEGVLDVRLYPELGAKVFVRGDFRDRIGHVIACGRTPDESGLTAEAARDRLRAITSDF